jgi:hypothetical protein
MWCLAIESILHSLLLTVITALLGWLGRAFRLRGLPSIEQDRLREGTAVAVAVPSELVGGLRLDQALAADAA